MAIKQPDEKTKTAFKIIIDSFRQQESSVRRSTVKDILKNESFWGGRQDVYWDDRAVAWQNTKHAVSNGLITEADVLDYDKYVNIYKAHGKAVIAASSIEFPKFTFLPEDFNSPLDILTGEVYAKIAEVIQRQNDGRALFAKAFFVRWNQHFVAIYNYHEFDAAFGMVEVEEDEPYSIEEEATFCPLCSSPVPELSGTCLTCMQPYQEAVMGKIKKDLVRKVLKSEPRGREILEVYGPKHVIIPRFASRQSDLPYLRFERDYHRTHLLGLMDKLNVRDRQDVDFFGEETEEMALRLPHPYTTAQESGIVLVSQDWIRPSAFWELGLKRKDEVKELKKKYPDGARVISINHNPVLCFKESLDDHWTLSISCTSDSIHDDPLGKDLIPINEMENEALQLALETLKQAISELFADPNVLNFKTYEKTEKMPGTVSPAEAKPGLSLDSAFYETRPASLSKEHDTFQNRLQSFGQLVVHAFPSIFGGAMQTGSQTYAEYAKSAQQALQVLGLDYQPIVDAFAKAMKKAVRSFIENMQTESTSYSYKEGTGAQVNLLIQKGEATGKVGDVTVDNSTQLPISWAELRAFVLEQFAGNNPQILSTFFHPENTTYIKSLIGMKQLYVPGESDRKKQLIEIEELLNSAPMPPQPPPPTGDVIMDTMQMQNFQAAPPPPVASVPVIEADNHQIHIDTITIWEVSEAGQLARTENPAGYENVMLHKQMHMQGMIMQQQQQTAKPQPGGENPQEPAPPAGEKNASA